MAIEYTPQDSSPPVTAIDYEPQNTSGLVSDPAEGGSFSASNEAELAGAQSFAAKAKEAQNAAEQSETNAAISESNAATSESNAATSETNAATSETNAATSESNASTSEANALASATAAQNSEVTSASFDTTDGTLTLTKANSDTLTTDLDGRYAELTGATFTGDVTFNEKIEFQKGSFSSYPTIEHWQTRIGSSSINGLFIDGEDRLSIQSSVYLDLKSYGNLLRLYGSSGHKFLECKLDSDDLRTTILYHGNSNEKLRTVSDGILVDSKVEAELFKGDLEGAVHFKGAVASGATLTKGDVVYVSGHSGQKTEVDLADASDSNKMPAFGIVAADPNGVNVDVVTFGTLKSIDTSTYTDGDELYVDTTAGGLTATAPSGEGNLVQKIAKVVRAHNSGNIKVMGAGRTNATPNLNDGNIFIGDSNNLATTASFATEVTNATTGKADLSGADFTGNVTTSGTLATGGYTLASTDGTNGQALVTDGSGNVSFGDVTVDVSGKADLSGATFTGSVTIADDDELIFGDGNDFKIYHNSTTNSSYIREQGTGSLNILGNNLYLTDTNGAKYLLGVSGGFTKLYYDDSEKLSTKSTGIGVTGDITLTGTVDGVDIATLGANAIVDGDFTTAGIMTTDGSGGYSVDSSTYATETYVDTAVSNLVDSAPATLDTLNELASALGDDANFSTTVTTSIGTKWTEDATKISNWDTAYSWGDHSTEGYLTAETNDLSTTVTWANVPDANITESSVTQHQAAISITESQISDLQTYLTAETNDLSTTVTWANVPDANITESSVTQHQAALSVTESQISDLGTYLTASDITGKANLSGATFTGNVSIGTPPSGTQSLTVAGTTNLHGGVTGGLDVTGDITVSGTVDGVDVSALATTANSAMQDLVDDTSPQLGSDLDLNGNNITGTGNISADTFTGGDTVLTQTGTLPSDAVLTLKSTDSGNVSAPHLLFDRVSSSPAGNDGIGSIVFQGRDSANQATPYITIVGKADDTVNASEDGQLEIYTRKQGVNTKIFDLTSNRLTLDNGTALTVDGNLQAGASGISSTGGIYATSSLIYGNTLQSAGNTTVGGNVVVTGTVDGRDVATDGARLDTIPYHKMRHVKLRGTSGQLNLTTSFQSIGNQDRIRHPSTPVDCAKYLDLDMDIRWNYISSAVNDLSLQVQLLVPSGGGTVTNMGTVTKSTPTGYTAPSYWAWHYVSGDYTHLFTQFGRINTGTGTSEGLVDCWEYNSLNNRTYFLSYNNPGVSFSTGQTLYWSPYAFESAGTLLTIVRDIDERYQSNSFQPHHLRFKMAYDDARLEYFVKMKEVSTADSANISTITATLTDIEEV